MQTTPQNKFVAQRLEAHKAGTAGIEADWLVRVAMQSRADSERVMANWKRLGEESEAAVIAARRAAPSPATTTTYIFRRQAD